MTQYIPSVNPEQTSGKTKELLSAVKAKLGVIPNIFKVFAHSTSVLEFYFGQAGALDNSSLSAALREQIALTVAGANGCDYCASAHTVLGKGAGVTESELQQNVHGKSADAKTQAALTFAKRIVETRGHTEAKDIEAIRAAGFNNAAIVEIVATTSLNIFTNYINHVANTEIDFPLVKTCSACSEKAA